jgi:predicted Zn-dependent peptidase
MKMVFIANGSRNKTLDSFDQEIDSLLKQHQQQQRKQEQLARTQENSQNTAIVEREIINRSFKINMIDRLQQATGCSSCGK